jgi:hypothetical protein
MDVPFQQWHGQKMLAYRHPAFSDGDPEQWLAQAFRQDYEENSSSMLRMVETSIRGCEYLSSIRHRDECLEARLEQFRQQARVWRLILPAVRHNAVNDKERRRARALEKRAAELFGLRAWERAAGLGTIALAAVWKLRLLLRGDVIQPKTIVTRYQNSARAGRRSSPEIVVRVERQASQELPPAAAAMSFSE